MDKQHDLAGLVDKLLEQHAIAGLIAIGVGLMLIVQARDMRAQHPVTGPAGSPAGAAGAGRCPG